METENNRSVAAINAAIDAIYKGSMEPWFWRKQTCREWFSRQDPGACRTMVPEIQRAMVTLRLDGKFNAGARMCDMLVYAVERGEQE